MSIPINVTLYCVVIQKSQTFFFQIYLLYSTFEYNIVSYQFRFGYLKSLELSYDHSYLFNYIYTADRKF